MSEQLEVFLQGTPDMAQECISAVADRLNSQGYQYSVRRTSGAPDWARWDKTYYLSCSVFETREDGEEKIGVIKLQLLPGERTLFSMPQPDSWDPSFREFLGGLFEEFERLGFVSLREEKPPIGFRLPHQERDV